MPGAGRELGLCSRLRASAGTNRVLACSSARRSASTVGAPSSRPPSPSYIRHASAGPLPGTANGSCPLTSRVGEPHIPQRAASSAPAITRRTVTAGRPASACASRCSSNGTFGHLGTDSTISSIKQLPGLVSVTGVRCLTVGIPVHWKVKR